MHPLQPDDFLQQVMHNGFGRAGESFSKIVNQPIKIVNTHVGVGIPDHHMSSLKKKQGDLIVLVTQIIGDLAGKSYLILNSEETREITSNNKASIMTEALNDAFLKEIDNIISASVISELSNALDLDIYGDVPQLIKMSASSYQQYMKKEITDAASTMVFCNTAFQFNNQEIIQPQFVWKLSTQVLQMIPTNRLTV